MTRDCITRKCLWGNGPEFGFAIPGHPSPMTPKNLPPTGAYGAAAEVVCQDEAEAEISAMVEYSRGTIMELLSQGSWVKALGPEKLLEDMKKELQKMGALYGDSEQTF